MLETSRPPVLGGDLCIIDCSLQSLPSSSRDAMEHSDFTSHYLREPGVEIGAFKTPIPGIKPTYVDRFAEYAGERTLADYYGDACELPFHDSSLHYVASSHVLEHVANPLAALKEWHRVLRPGAIIYTVVPDRRLTFDHLRPLTVPKHMLEDYHRGTTQSDGTHIDDFVFGVDWKKFSPTTPAGEEQASREQLATAYRAAVAAGLEINIHFHTFEIASLAALIALGNQHQVWAGEIEVIEQHPDFPSSNPNGFLLVARVRKPWSQRFRSLGSPHGLKKTAKQFPK